MLTTQHTANKRDEYACFSARFEPKIPKTERPNTHAFKSVAAGIGFHLRVMYTHIYTYILLPIISICYRLAVHIDPFMLIRNGEVHRDSILLQILIYI